MTPNQSESFSSTDRTERKVGPLLAFSLSYLDEVLEGESLEVQRHWSRVHAAASASAINAELLEALHAAATSLETISSLAGRENYGNPPIKTHMDSFLDVRLYAAARARVARESLAAIKRATA